METIQFANFTSISTNGVCKNNSTLCSSLEGKSQICINFGKNGIEKSWDFQDFSAWIDRQWSAHTPNVCPWSAHDLPVICRWSPMYLQVATVKMRKMFVFVIFFDFAFIFSFFNAHALAQWLAPAQPWEGTCVVCMAGSQAVIQSEHAFCWWLLNLSFSPTSSLSPNVCPWSAHDLPMICPWSAHGRPYIYRWAL